MLELRRHRVSAEAASGRGPRPAVGRPRPGPRPGAASRPGTPRTTATGMPRSLPMTSSAAEAISSATQTSVATSSRPPASSVPFRSTTAATPAHPMATSVTPRRQGRPKVSETMTPTSMPSACCSPARIRRRRAVGVVGQQRRRPFGHVGEVDPGVGADEAVPGLADHEIAAPSQDPGRLPLDQRQLGRRVGVVDGDELPLGLGDDLLGDHHDVPGEQLGAVRLHRAPGRRRSAPPGRCPGVTSPMPATGTTSTPSAGGIEHHPGQRRPPGRASP